MAQEVSTGDYNTALNTAENTPHLTVNKTTKTVEVADSDEAQALVDAETAKLNSAINTQKANNQDYEDKCNDPDYLVQAEEPYPGFSKANVIDLLTDSSGFNYADVNTFNAKNASEVFYNNEEVVYNDSGDGNNPNKDFHIASVGDYMLQKKVFKDVKTGKWVDIKVTVTGIDRTGLEANQQKILCLNYNGGGGITITGWDTETEKTVFHLSNNSIKFRAQFFESGTNKPITVSIADIINDIDDREKYEFVTNANKVVVSDTIPTTLIADTTQVVGTTTIGEYEGEGALYDPAGSAMFVLRNKSSFNFNWNHYYFRWTAPNLKLNTPELKETTVNVNEYVFVQKASFKYVDDKENSISGKTNLKGNPGDKIPVTDVNNTINTLTNKGWDTTYTPNTNTKYDNDVDKDQNFTVPFTPHVEKITVDNPHNAGDPTDRDDVVYPEGVTKNDLTKTITRTIKYVYADGSEAFPSVTQKVTLTREATFNYVTGEVEYSDWSTDAFDQKASPTKENYTYDKSVVDSLPVDGHSTNTVEVVTYNKIPQKGSVAFVDDLGTELAPTKKLNGYNEEPFGYEPGNTITALENKGYDVKSNDFPEDGSFDKDPETDQDFTVAFTPHVETITSKNPHNAGDATDRNEVVYPEGVTKDDLSKTITRTIKYVDEEGNEMAESVVQTVELTRTAKFNYVTGKVTYSTWTTKDIDEALSPEIEDYTREIDKVDGKTITVDDENETITVVYKKIPQKGKVSFLNGEEEIAEPKILDGFNRGPFDYDPADTIKDLENKGYDLVESDYPENEEDRVFDTDTEVDQEFIVSMVPHIEKITADDAKAEGDPTDREGVKYPAGITKDDLSKTLTRTIFYKYADGTQAKEPVVQTVTLTREAEFNYVTGEVTYSDWTTGTFEGVESPEIEGFTVDLAKVDGVNLTFESETEDVTVTYTAIPEDEKPDVIPKDVSNDYKVGAVDTGDVSSVTPLVVVASGSLGGIATALASARRRKKK